MYRLRPVTLSNWVCGEKGSKDAILPESVAIELRLDGEAPIDLLRPAASSLKASLAASFPAKDAEAGATLAVYADPGHPLKPASKYTIRVTARSRNGGVLSPEVGTWQFNTEAEPAVHAVQFDLDLNNPAVRWHGGFFTGFCNVAFCTSHANRIPTYELMEQVRRTSPRAWSLQRDFWLTGMEQNSHLFPINLPNIVRERETRHISAIEPAGNGTLLRVEDFFGHEQYGIPSGRPVSDDYRPGDEILVADGVHSGRAKVVKADDRERSVLVTGLTAPAGGWKLAYARPLPTKEDPNAPGLFPPGGCHLIKFKPCGTPVYYWGRLDLEWDLDHRRFQRRVLPNFADCAGRSVDRRSGLDNRQGLRRAARGRPCDRRPHHRPLRRRGPDLSVEHIQRAGPVLVLLAIGLERASKVLRLHD